ncbi:uncharacterized protein MONOS_5947 [Monocercomonoides exilis]|uniref:uncharacterized protein n=1 Tax=Monocercomonoides exilis TaxID=2049356 RepID=UPI00355993CE|nr:hypothetical protein MONOS_5947 [Monocercomonoides exilis]|eukprot:MONOS_5947.1-p1 / transcript=MONOS_5947.1 / gene=MONOS_5947 / organism=Monocercomonoides_exilis_PA203 / gene_product=unspecified product / transcript_product=unspecified product / location=Mono_scaffold00180:4336-6399(-) / protein_length=330 / sequence_SO=supercontig / SO=protein_coding / is_pseudo=false
MQDNSDLSIFPKISFFLRAALDKPNLQSALDWIFQFGALGEMDFSVPLTPIPVQPKEQKQTKQISSPKPVPKVSLDQIDLTSKPKTEGEKSALSKKLLDLIDSGYDPDDLVNIIPKSKAKSTDDNLQNEKEQDSSKEEEASESKEEEKTIQAADGAAECKENDASATKASEEVGQTPTFEMNGEGFEQLKSFLASQKGKVSIAGGQELSPEDEAAINAIMNETPQGGVQNRMTAEEIKAKARKMQEEARKRIAEKEKQDELERERRRIQMGKQLSQEKEKHEMTQLRLQREERLRQKRFEQQELARVRANIAADKERRKKEAEARKKTQ